MGPANPRRDFRVVARNVIFVASFRSSVAKPLGEPAIDQSEKIVSLTAGRQAAHHGGAIS